MRLIDADELRQTIESKIYWGGVGLLEAIDDAPTVDALVLPCKPGDSVYIVRECSCHVYGRWNNPKGKCTGKVYLGQKLRAYHCGYVTEAQFEVKHISNFGKTVFLTREEAEAALAERKMNDA